MMIPSIDLMDGKAVQLKQGRERVLERDSPLELARHFGRTGEIAVIDIDAALGRGSNAFLIREICRVAECRVGGGLRTVAAAREAVAGGAARVIVGTAALGPDGVHTAFLRELAATVGRSRIIVALDSWDGEVLNNGWTGRTGFRVEDALAGCEPYCGEFLCTFVEKEGTLAGLPVDRAIALAGKTGNHVTAAGGAASLEDIERLARAGLDVQLGLAVYTGRISPAGAFIASLDWSRTLIPTIVQDEDGRVLMLAWSDRESLARSLDDGRMHFHSRSRGRLWLKGETSGHFLDLVGVRADCDADAVLATVRPRGPACHRGTPSCFGPLRFSLGELAGVLADRMQTRPEGSYTATLDEETLAGKIREEAEELIEARVPGDVAWEAADVLYFTLVKMIQAGISWNDVARELQRRRQT